MFKQSIKPKMYKMLEFKNPSKHRIMAAEMIASMANNYEQEFIIGELHDLI